MGLSNKYIATAPLLYKLHNKWNFTAASKRGQSQVYLNYAEREQTREDEVLPRLRLSHTQRLLEDYAMAEQPKGT